MGGGEKGKKQNEQSGGGKRKDGIGEEKIG